MRDDERHDDTSHAQWGIARTLAAALVVVLVTSCRSIFSPPTAPDHETTDAPPSETTQSPAGTAQSWTMPDLRGKNLQAAQDAIQELTDFAVFYTGSTDLTGQGRNQMWDRNWQVCSPTPAPGEAFTTATRIDFGVVRIDGEKCP